MEERYLPTPDNNIICAPDDISILDFYKGYYESVYIILHPFIQIIHPEKLDFYSDNDVCKEDIVKYTKKLSWNDFLKISPFQNIQQLDIALRTSIGGLNKKFENKKAAKTLQAVVKKHNLVQPAEGRFSALLIDDMLRGIQHLGHKWIFIGDELGTERKLEYVQDIIENKLTPNYYINRNWYTHKNEILYSVHWDSHFTLLCSDQQTIKTILDQFPFEGFFCKKETEIYWSTS